MISILKKIAHPNKWYIVGICLCLFDVLTILGSYFLSLYVAYGCDFSFIPQESIHQYWHTVPYYMLICLLVYSFFRFYTCVWRQVSYYEFITFACITIILSVLYMIIGISLDYGLPKRYYVIGGWMQCCSVLFCRFFYRFFNIIETRLKRKFKHRSVVSSRAMLIGAGSIGQIILRDANSSSLVDVDIKCIIDDDPSKWYSHLLGVPIVGGRDDILLNVKKYKIEEILFAISTISPEDKRDMLNICKESGCKLRILPGVFELINGEITLERMKPVEVEDLLGRDVIKVNNDEILQHLQGKVVMVTGGGGSIGSELCRQIASHSPKLLIIFDIYENNAYDIQQELKLKDANLNFTVLIGSVRDTARIHQVFETYKPEIVFHAAAHKHVPLMEVSPYEAIKNNVLGTYKTAHAAMMNGCKRFLLISTDKAVNPTNVMGATKRLCEIVIQAMNIISQSHKENQIPEFLAHHGEYSTKNICTDKPEQNKTATEFVAVRFGNVLGSNGSVIPLFKKQILNGGPVTVTHPDIIRYFMTIPEAVSLVLQSSAYARGGEIFVLNMGEPVKIDTLARNLIKLSGYKPDVDIAVEYVGLRPGEKLYEEKLMAEEGMKTTANKLIHIAKPLEINLDSFLEKMVRLANLAYENNPETINVLKELVPTFNHIKNP